MAGTCVCDLSERTEKDRGALVGTSAQSAPLQFVIQQLIATQLRPNV